MNKTKIPTAEYTWNAMTGCDQICFEGDCYAYQMIKRFGGLWGYDWTPRLHSERLKEPLELEKPSLIFGPSMGDIMTPSLIDLEVWAIIDTMMICDWHRFQVQTKFAKRLPSFKWPSNVWLGVSLCYARDVHKLDYLRKTDARIKYAYCEPLLEELDPDFTDIDWVVIGAKTGAHKFQPPPLWTRKLTILAYEAGAKVFHKPNLDWPYETDYRSSMNPGPIRDFPDEEWFKSRLSLPSATKEDINCL